MIDSKITFFDENCSTVFKIDFSSISLIDLIKDEKVYVLLYKANELIRESIFAGATEKIALSFEILLNNYLKRLVTIQLFKRICHRDTESQRANDTR